MVLLLVEITHTNFTEVTGMVFVQIYPNMSASRTQRRDSVCTHWFGDGADHQLDLYLLDAFGW
jgi:hypothetical protein